MSFNDNNANTDEDFGDFLEDSKEILKEKNLEQDVAMATRLEPYDFDIIPMEPMMDQDINLNQLNVQCEDDGSGQKEYIDLDAKPTFKEEFYYPECEFENPVDFTSEVEYQPETKEQFHEFYLQQREEFVDVNHSEVLLPPTTPFSEYAASDYSIPTSPYQDLGNYSVIGNNTNEMPRVMRTRKMSSKSDRSSIAKVIGKPFRQRATKAEMELLDEEDRKSRKRDQNSKNAKKCVEKKNNKKAELEQLVEEREKQLEVARAKNTQSEARLKQEYLMYLEGDNNSPYGAPQGEQGLDNCWDKNDSFPLYFNRRNTPEFDSIISGKLSSVVKPIQMRNERNIADLMKKLSIAENKFENVVKQDVSKMNNNTFASQKSRANKALAIAENEHRAACLEDLISQEMAKDVEIGRMREEFYLGVEQPFGQHALNKKRLPH